MFAPDSYFRAFFVIDKLFHMYGPKVTGLIVFIRVHVLKNVNAFTSN